MCELARDGPIVSLIVRFARSDAFIVVREGVRLLQFPKLRLKDLSKRVTRQTSGNWARKDAKLICAVWTGQSAGSSPVLLREAPSLLALRLAGTN